MSPRKSLPATCSARIKGGYYAFGGFALPGATATGQVPAAMLDFVLDQANSSMPLSAASDHLQVLINDHLVLDEQSTDFDFVGAGGREWGWALGGPGWGGQSFEGQISDFRLGDQFEFLDGHVPTAPTA